MSSTLLRESRSPIYWDSAYWHGVSSMPLGPEERQLLRSSTGVREGQFVVDVGCGRGTLAAIMAFWGARVLGLDFSEVAIAAARSTFEVEDLHFDKPGPPESGTHGGALRLRHSRRAETRDLAVPPEKEAAQQHHQRRLGPGILAAWRTSRTPQTARARLMLPDGHRAYAPHRHVVALRDIAEWEPGQGLLDVGLLAEEWDSHLQRQLGNFPQGFSHLGVVEVALGLALGDQRASLPVLAGASR